MLEPEALHAAGELADTLAERDLPAGAASAVLGGAVITVFTWLAEAAESDLTRLFIALAVGFVLLAPSMNHSVVGFGEILFGIVADTTDADWVDLLRKHRCSGRWQRCGRRDAGRLREERPGGSRGMTRRQADGTSR